MKWFEYPLIFSLLFYFSLVQAQDLSPNGIEINYSTGFSGSFNTNAVISTAPFSPSPDIIVDEMTAARITNFTINAFSFFNKSSGIKLTYGRSQNGFHFSGKNSATFTMAKGTFLSRSKQLGISYIRRMKMSNSGKLILESGIHYDLQPEFDSNTFFIYPRDAYSLAGYIGYEIPMIAHKYYATFGLLFKLPLSSYVVSFDYRPYFVGARIGVNFQFSWRDFLPG